MAIPLKQKKLPVHALKHSRWRMELEEKEEHDLGGGVPWCGQMDSMG